MAITLEQVEEHLLSIKNRLIEKKGEVNNIKSILQRRMLEISAVKEDEAVLIQSKQLLQDTAEFARTEAKHIIESLVTKSLQYVFEDPDIRFEVEIKPHKNRTDCNFYIIENGKRRDPIDDNGGGLVNIVALILRVALIQASNNISLDDDIDEQVKIDAPFIFDEPFKELSAKYIPKMGRFLRELSEKLDIQINIITHNVEILKYADKKFKVHLDENKVSHVTVLE
jgi:DNA repair exonuclease SbcCD ATPase subunit